MATLLCELTIIEPVEPVPKLIDYALKRATFGCMVLGQALAVFQAFSLAKLQNYKVAFPKTEVLGKPLFYSI
jgi:hypothetical protein